MSEVAKFPLPPSIRNAEVLSDMFVGEEPAMKRHAA